MWFGVLISCIILVGNVLTVHCKSVGVMIKTYFFHWIITEYISRVACWKWKNLSLKSATSFLTKSNRISLETSWLLKFEIWRISVCIHCNFSRYLDQVSNRNYQPLLFFNFLTRYNVWISTTDIPLAEEVGF